MIKNYRSLKADLDDTILAYNHRMQPARVIPTTRRKSDLHAYDILPTTHQNCARHMENNK